MAQLPTGDELLSQLQTLRQIAQKSSSRSVLAGLILRGVSRDLTAALSVLKSGEPVVDGRVDLLDIEEGSASSRSPAAAGGLGSSENLARGQKQNDPCPEGKHHARKIHTYAPYDDGHEWRKYGQKNIKNSKFPTNYYRCTYRKELKCPATKQVQQKDCVEPPMFLVIYNNEHTCDAMLASTAHQVMVASPPRDPCLLCFDSSTHKDHNQDSQIPADCPTSRCSSCIQPPLPDLASTEPEKTAEQLPVSLPDVLLSMSPRPLPDLDLSEMYYSVLGVECDDMHSF